MYIASLCLRVDKLDPTLRRCTFCVQMNLIFLCNIVRLLVTKLRAVNSPDAVQTKSVYSQYRTIVKITPIAINPSLLDWAIWMRSRACLVKIENVVIDSKANSYIAVFYSQLHGEKNAEIARARTHPCLLPFVMPRLLPSPGVRPSVCLSRSGVAPKFFHRRVANKNVVK